MITAGTCRGTGCGFCALSWSVVEIGGIRDITLFIKVISFGLSIFLRFYWFWAYWGLFGVGLLLAGKWILND